MPHAPILFNPIYLFTKKYQNITYKLFWASMNIFHLIGPQIFPISLFKLGHNINHYCGAKELSDLGPLCAGPKARRGEENVRGRTMKFQMA